MHLSSPSRIGWTLADWRAAYRSGRLKLNDVYDASPVADGDSAWIARIDAARLLHGFVNAPRHSRSGQQRRWIRPEGSSVAASQVIERATRTSTMASTTKHRAQHAVEKR